VSIATVSLSAATTSGAGVVAGAPCGCRALRSASAAARHAVSPRDSGVSTTSTA
jgi:hypothetical protein